MRLYFATSNEGKVASLQKALTPHGVDVVPVAAELPEPQTLDLRAIASAKALAAAKLVDGPVVVQDTGFYLSAWNGFPGPFVKFTLQTLGLDGLTALAQRRSPECEFRECLAYVSKKIVAPIFFEASVPGALAEAPRGKVPEDAWSELLCAFIPKGYTKTVAEMSKRERETWRRSRDQNSAAKFAEWFVVQQH